MTGAYLIRSIPCLPSPHQTLYNSLYFGLVRFTTIHQMLLFIIIFLDIKHFDLNFCDVIIIEIHYHLNKRASWEREQEWCHAIFVFFSLNFVYHIASIFFISVLLYYFVLLLAVSSYKSNYHNILLHIHVSLSLSDYKYCHSWYLWLLCLLSITSI